jgi:hypothetical protein
MKFKKLKDRYIISISPDEEIVETILDFLVKEKIDNAFLFGIGAINYLELGHYKVENKKYSKKIIKVPLEIANLLGNVFLLNGKPVLHAHITAANDSFETFSGHLGKAIVSAACEIILIQLESKFSRKYSEEIGLNLLDIT